MSHQADNQKRNANPSVLKVVLFSLKQSILPLCNWHDNRQNHANNYIENGLSLRGFKNAIITMIVSFLHA